MGYKGQFAILSAASTATNQNAWIKYMKLELKKPAYKNMKLVKIYYGNDNPAQSRQATVSMLQAYPNLKGIESPTTVGISSAAQYLSTSKYKGKVALTGLGLPSQMKKYVHDGTVKAFALWNPEDLGYLAGYAVSALADGKIKGKVGETFKAGKLGTYKIIKGPDKQAAGDPRPAVRVHDQERRQVQVLGATTRWGRRADAAPPRIALDDRDDTRLPTRARARARPEELRRRPRARGRRHRAAIAGEVHGLVGENGAGKSTLVKILAGVHRPDAGRLLLDGEEAIFDSAKQSQAAGIAIIFQEPTLFPDLTRRGEHLRRRAAAQALPPHRRAGGCAARRPPCSSSSACGSTPTGWLAGSRSPTSSSSRSRRR